MNKFRILLAASVASVAFTPLMTPAAYAQETTTSIRGTVTSSGAPVGGATVKIVHVPSNTTTTVTTSSDGSFNANGLRAGGPFTVSVSAEGYQGAQVTDVTTTLDAPYYLPVELATEGQVIVVTANSVRGAGTAATGSDTLLRASDIASVPTVNRDIRDLARRSALATVDLANNRALSFAGMNPRFNRFTIDGVQVNDSYGLNADGLPTKRGPVPLEAIGQFTARIAPYDISDGLFQGGVVNAVLRSGTNHFQGNAFFTETSDGLTGNRYRNVPVNLNFLNKDYGGEISGPIIKDKLFFMVAYEKVEEGQPFADGPAGEGFGNVIPGLTRSEITSVQDIAKNAYSYDTGDVVTSEPKSSEFFTAKLDANISDRQRVSLTWINAYDVTPSSYDTSNSTSTPSLGLRSHYYSTAERLHAGIAQWNADWTDKLSTEARLIYKNYVQPATPLMGLGIGMLQVCTDPSQTVRADGGVNSSAYNQCFRGATGVNGSPTINIGPDQYRHANLVKNENWGGSFALRYTAGNHDFKAIAEYTDHLAYNLFMPASLGVWGFDSLADFQNHHATYFKYSNALSLDPEDGAVNFHYQNYDFGLQDKWQVTDTLQILAAVRWDVWGGTDRPALNQDFVKRYGFANNTTYDGLDVAQPRLSFDYRPTSRLKLSGGFGKFAAGQPDIYLGNSFGNTGVLTNTVTIQETSPGVYTGAPADVAAAVLNNVDGKTIPQSVKDYLTKNTASLSTAPVVAMDPNFKMPAQWRGTASADYKLNLGPLGDGWYVGADFVYTSTIHGIGFLDLRAVPSGMLTPDGRTRYMEFGGGTSGNRDILLTNFDRGRAYIGSVRLEKEFDNGLSFGGSFTLQDVKDNAPITSSQATSLYAQAVFADPNISAYGTSNDETKWAYKYHIGYEHAFFGDYKTIFQLFGETHAGRPFSFTMGETSSATRSPSFGTVGNTGNYLLYVPTGLDDAKVSYDSAATAAALDNLINNTSLSKYRGQIAGRNIGRSHPITRIDLHLEQEIPTFLGKSRFSVFADVENVLNLLNKDWGVFDQYPFAYAQTVVRVQCITAPTPTGTAGTASTVGTPCAQYRYSSYAAPKKSLSDPVTNSLYLIRLGARFKF